MDLFREVLRRIDGYVEERQLQPGQRLPSDRELAAALGVSRPLVRQALKVLEGLGRVVAHQGAGTFVADHSHRVAAAELVRGLELDRELLRRLLPARVAIECEVMREAFRHRSTEALAELERTLRERAERLEDEGQEAGLDLGFEAALGRVCGNEVLRRLQALVHEVWLQAQIAVGSAPDDRFRLHQEHLIIFEAFRIGDQEGALAALEAHLGSLTPAGG
jgi:GntR family transcriptional repressor for pyruvate dehydrogenase complex